MPIFLITMSRSTKGSIGMACAITLVVLVIGAAAQAPAIEPRVPLGLDSATWEELLAAEDARATTPEQLRTLVRGTQSGDDAVRRISVRALGRLERPDVVRHILPLLEDVSDTVRAEAANALGQAVFRADPGEVIGPLLAHLTSERDPWVRGLVAQTLGRLAHVSVDTVALVTAALLAASNDVGVEGIVGFARGFESLVRQQRGKDQPAAQLVSRLRELARFDSPDGRRAAHVRRLAVAALVGSGQVDSAFLLEALDDADAQVRRLAVRAAVILRALEGRERVMTRGLSDRAALVRFAAVQGYGQMTTDSSACDLVRQLADDENVHVALLAIDKLAACRRDPRAADLLQSLASGEVNGESWHRPAHALVALAGASPGRLTPLLDRALVSEISWVRLYAARAATAAEARSILEQLAFDADDNVREAAVSGLIGVAGHDADSVYIALLDRSGYQLIITVMNALAETPLGKNVVPALLGALDRITAEHRETSRDARSALLARIGELGDVEFAEHLRPYLADFDEAVANQAAMILTRWTGTEHVAAPAVLQAPSLPTLREIRELAAARPTLQMRAGGEIVLRLLPYDAPTNAARFARLARRGYFDGLTFHRVVQGFVIQGGSPGANEFIGDGPYTRDELTMRSHVRGTIGVSTRGRDTGDGQIFVNLVDNPRLDHNYTIFAEVVEGMDIVDDIVEGSIIDRIIWR